MYKVVYSTEGLLYEQYESECDSRYNRRCIDNTIVGCSRCVGYCKYNGHSGFLTNELRKKHNCIEKQCIYYVEKPVKKSSLQLNIDLTSSVLSMAHKLMKNNEYTRVIRVESISLKTYNAYYVSITNECNFNEYTIQIKNELGVDVNFVNLQYDFDKCVKLLYNK